MLDSVRLQKTFLENIRATNKMTENKKEFLSAFRTINIAEIDFVARVSFK